MKRIAILSILGLLNACGAIGIGGNHDVMIHNNSNDLIFAQGEMGRIKIRPNTSMKIHTGENIHIASINNACDELTVQRRLNAPAAILDVMPGFIFGMLPLLVDSVAGDLYRMPREFFYECQ